MLKSGVALFLDLPMTATLSWLFMTHSYAGNFLQSDSLIESFGGAKQRMNMIRRQRHGIDKDMINDALDAAQVEQLNVSMSDTPEKKRKTG